jgi:glycosyltransferase involved in cell wall biosynthesis
VGDRNFYVYVMKVIYFCPGASTFIKRDFDILEKHCRLVVHEFNPTASWKMLFEFVNQLFFIIKNFQNTDLFICHFLGYHSLLPVFTARLLKIPFLAIVAGTECHSYPSINYGSFRKPIYGWVTRLSFRKATHIAPVHETLVFFEDIYYGVDGNQGYTVFAPNTRAPFTPLYYGFRESFFQLLPNVERKPNSFLTVAKDLTKGEFYRKGIDLILQAAKAFPDYTYTIVGDWEGDLPALPNIAVLSPMPVEKLVALYNSHEFYFQLSIAEGFPNAICEAMMCGCIPIGSSVYAIPLIIGYTGFILPKKDFAQLKALIQQAVACDKKELSKAASDRIRNEFPESRRERELITLIKKLTIKKS